MKKSFSTAITVQNEKLSVLCGTSLTTISKSVVMGDGSVASGSGGLQIKTEDIETLIDLLTEAKKSLERAENFLKNS